MSSKIQALLDPKRWSPILSRIALPIGSLMFQSIVLAFLSIFGRFIIIMITPETFWKISSLPSGHSLTVIKIWVLTLGLIYGLVWYVYWWMVNALNSRNQIPAFTAQVLAAWLPLLAVLYFINPVSNPDAMIPISRAEITFNLSLIMTAAALFPCYSYMIYKFVILPDNGKKFAKPVMLWILFSAASVSLLPVFWELAPSIYQGISDFPHQ